MSKRVERMANDICLEYLTTSRESLIANCLVPIAARFLQTIEAQARAEALEEAAKVCDGLEMNSTMTKAISDRCAREIRQLKDTDNDNR